MTYLAKPRLHHPDLPKNKLGFTRRDYEGPVSTLCAGCGHDSISAAIILRHEVLDRPTCPASTRRLDATNIPPRPSLHPCSPWATLRGCESRKPTSTATGSTA
jgi:hypothetical protein